MQARMSWNCPPWISHRFSVARFSQKSVICQCYRALHSNFLWWKTSQGNCYISEWWIIHTVSCIITMHRWRMQSKYMCFLWIYSFWLIFKPWECCHGNEALENPIIVKWKCYSHHHDLEFHIYYSINIILSWQMVSTCIKIFIYPFIWQI